MGVHAFMWLAQAEYEHVRWFALLALHCDGFLRLRTDETRLQMSCTSPEQHLPHHSTKTISR